MSILGKILAIFNVLAVVGVLVLLGMNYAKRLNWEYAVFRQDLMIEGLPLDKTETDAEQLPVIEKIGEKTRQDLFKQVSPSTPVVTQEEELNRVKGELERQYQAAGAEKWKQIAALARILTPMAETYEQRQRLLAYQTHLRDEKTLAEVKRRLAEANEPAEKRAKDAQPKPYEEAFHDVLGAKFTAPLGPLAEAFLAAKKADANATVEKAVEQSIETQFTQLKAQFDQMFVNARNGGEGVKPGAVPQQKRTIARLLFNMVEVTNSAQPAQGQGAATPLDLASNPAYKRFFIIVGVKAALEAVNEQAEILRDLAFEMEAERPRERGLFAVEQRKAVDLVRDKKTQVDQHKSLLDLKKKELETHTATYQERQKDVAQYEKDLAAARKETAKNLAKLRDLSQKLLAKRVELRNQTQDIQNLEHEIRTLEEGR
jgi:hypothetical protein